MLGAEDWRQQAACRGQGNTPQGISQFYPDQGAHHVNLSFCQACPVVAECQQYADDNRITDGVWGGRVRTRDEFK